MAEERDLEPYVRRRTTKGGSEERRKIVAAMTDEEERALRSCINSRERRRMHDLNDAMEELRSVLPYCEGTTGRRMSKISTLVLATNWIRHLSKSNAALTAQLQSSLLQKDKSTPKFDVLSLLQSTPTPSQSPPIPLPLSLALPFNIPLNLPKVPPS